MPEQTTLFAPATGPGRSAVSVIRISGPASAEVIRTLAGPLPAPRRLSLRTLRAPDGTPLDEALAQAVVDISGRPYLVHSGEPDGFEQHLIGGHFTGSLVRHTFEAIAFNGALTVHVRVLGGRDPHHIAEAEYKAFARAFRQAKALDPLVDGIPSTKGAL